MSFLDPSPKLGDSDNNLLQKICQILASGGGALTSFVLKVGDTMTGALQIASGILTGDAPALKVTQTWNNAAVEFTGVEIDVTNTASAAENALFRVQENNQDRFRVDNTGRSYFTRQVADTAPTILELRKRGHTGDADAVVGSGASLGRIDFRGWNGVIYMGGATIQGQAQEAFSAVAGGTNLIFNVSAIGQVTAVTRMTISSAALNLASGTAYQLAGVALFNPRSVYAAGTVYTLTNVSAAVDFGTTDPIITVNAVGTYAIRAKVKVALNGATFAANQTLTVKLRRTNNTAADVANSSTTWVVPIVTTITNTLAVIELPEVLYTTALTTDTLQIFADISVVPSAGTISIDEASIVAIRTS
jgi:hypothetical protein